MKPFPQKWRPSLGMIVVMMLLVVLCLPLGGIWLFRFYDRHLVRQTESELIVQGAFLKAIVVRELSEQNFDPARLSVNAVARKDPTFNIILPQLDLSSSPILPRRADAKWNEIRPTPIFSTLGNDIQETILAAQKTTLAGYRILDPNGIVIMGRSETGQSLAHVPEIKQALAGQYSSVIRKRVSDNPTPSIYSISRGTGIRVFVAMPIEYQGKIAGVVYLSRTPSHFLRELYGQRWNVAIAIVFILAITLVIGLIFVRTIKGPVDALNARTSRIAKGDRTALEPLAHHGTREIANLSQGLLSMSEKLQDRSDYIRTFATHVSHELKSPLTSIKGAAELMADQDSEMSAQAQRKFLKNIINDTDRLSQLLDRLRDLAAADSLATEGECRLGDVTGSLRHQFPDLRVSCDNDDQMIPLPIESAMIVFSNMADNSTRHGATGFDIQSSMNSSGLSLKFSDDGKGISEANREKVFELFFTTRREHGGTGMGLGIIQSILRTHGGSITLINSSAGAVFEITLPNP
ncbi:MAG: ATP-binding protein [Pseudomonadota bacterium]